MNIILIRHGEKKVVPGSPDSEAPLTQHGIEQVDELKDQLEQLHLKPEIYFTSKFKRAEQTAERLADVYPIDVLTPDTSTPTNPDTSSEHVLDAIIDEAKKEGIELDQQTTIAIVGHEPQLGQVLASLTSTPVKPIDIGKGVWVKAASLSDFLRGNGKVQEM